MLLKQSYCRAAFLKEEIGREGEKEKRDKKQARSEVNMVGGEKINAT